MECVRIFNGSISFDAWNSVYILSNSSKNTWWSSVWSNIDRSVLGSLSPTVSFSVPKDKSLEKWKWLAKGLLKSKLYLIEVSTVLDRTDALLSSEQFTSSRTSSSTRQYGEGVSKLVSSDIWKSLIFRSKAKNVPCQFVIGLHWSFALFHWCDQNRGSQFLRGDESWLQKEQTDSHCTCIRYNPGLGLPVLPFQSFEIFFRRKRWSDFRKKVETILVGNFEQLDIINDLVIVRLIKANLRQLNVRVKRHTINNASHVFAVNFHLTSRYWQIYRRPIISRAEFLTSVFR